MRVAEKLVSSDAGFDGCFGCGSSNPVGLKLEFERVGDTVRSRVSVSSDYAGYRAFAHGGVIATMLDEAMGWAMLHIAGHYGVTKHLNVSYRRPVFVDRPVVLSARVSAQEDSRVFLEARIEDERGRVLAAAEGEWSIVREERAA
jgi:uncharacterized protein (TIGR00369 family)